MQRAKTTWYDHQVAEIWRPEYPECSMYDFLSQAAQRYANLPALWLEGRRTSFTALMRLVDEASAAFFAMGVRAGDIVSILSPNLPQAVVAFYGLNRIGAVANMIHPLLSPAEIQRHVERTGSKVVVLVDQLYEKLAGIQWSGARPKCVLIRVSDALPFPKRQVYALREKAVRADNCIPWRDFIRAGRGVQPDIPADHARSGDATAVIMYSGGTSGEAKGVLLTNRNFNALAIQSYETMGIRDVAGMKVLAILPIFHGTGLGVDVHSMLCNGLQVYLIPVFNAQKCFKLVFREKIEFLFGVPAFYEALSRSPEIEKHSCAFMRVLGSCGDKLPEKTRERMNKYLSASGSDVTLTNGYGMTECTAGCCYEPFFGKKPGTSGIMVPDMLAKIVVPGTETEVPRGQSGELCIAGPTVMKGYYLAPEATAKTLRRHADGITWLHSGDAFSMDEDGFLIFQQRLDRMFIVSGYNIYPSEIENVIQTVPGVQQACVVGKAAGPVGRTIVAYLMLNPAAEQADVIDGVRRACADNLAAYAQPARIVCLDAFPRTRMNKVDYQSLEKM